MADRLTTLGVTAARADAPVAKEFLVDLSPEPAKAKVVREGYQVPPVNLDEKKSSFFLDNLKTLPPKQEPRVVSQTIPPGTKVLPGTAVGLVLAPASDIPFDIFDNLHRDLRGKNVNVLTDGILEDPVIRQTLLKYNTAAEVSPADKTALTAAFGRAGINVDDANADTGFGSAFGSARGALAFR